MKLPHKKGIGLIEVVIAVAIFSILIGFLILITDFYLSGAQNDLESTQGAYLAEEGIEAVKSMSDVQWKNISTLSTTTNYYLSFSTTSSLWATSSKNSATGIFYRSFSLADVRRDAEGNIVASGGTFDPESKKITVSVSWMTKSGTTTQSLAAYIPDILGD